MNGINLKRHGAEIGRRLRNFQYERTPGGLLIGGGMNALVNGAFKHTLYQGESVDPAIDPNLVVNEGLDYLLNVAFASAAPTTAWYVAIFSGNVNPAAGWTGANWVAAATEQTNYASATRPAWTLPGVTSTQTIGNSASEAMFEFNDDPGDVGYNAYGAALVSASAKSSTSGRLFAATRFANPRLGLEDPDKLGVQYVVTAQDAG